MRDPPQNSLWTFSSPQRIPYFLQGNPPPGAFSRKFPLPLSLRVREKGLVGQAAPHGAGKDQELWGKPDLLVFTVSATLESRPCVPR